MEKNDTLRNLIIAGGVSLAVLWIAPALLPVPPHRGGKPDAQAPQTLTPGPSTRTDQAPARVPAAESSPGQTQPLATPETATGIASKATFTVVEAAASEERILGTPLIDSKDIDTNAEPFRMRLTLSNVGASIESATVTDHAEDLSSPARYRLLSPIKRPHGATYRSLAVSRINLDGEDIVLSDKKWHVAKVETYHNSETDGNGKEGESVKFWIDIQKDDSPVVRVTRVFRLPRQPRKLHRHDLVSEIELTNLSKQNHQVLVAFQGGLGVRRINPRMDDRFVDYAVVDSIGRVTGHRKAHHSIVKQAERQLSLFKPSATEPETHFSWAATANTYFTCTIAPLSQPGSQDLADYLAEVVAFDADGSSLTGDDVTVRFVTTSAAIAPGGTLAFPAEVYLGEKEAKAFRSVETYAKRNYYCQISQGFGFCTFTWLVELMIWLFGGLFAVVHDFGVAIIILVLIVRLLLHPITKKGQVNMVRMQHKMQELAPKIEEVKKKYANDKARLQQEMMKLNINPAGQILTCLPMFIQMPIWVALWISLSNNISMRHQPFHFTWIHDLTAPDALFHFASPISIPIFGHIAALNLLPLLLAVAMYMNQKLMPKPAPNPNMSEQQKSQQQMMGKMGPLMSIMMGLIFYKAPSGLTLYIMASSMFGTIEQYRIREHIKRQEKAGTLHRPSPTKGDDRLATGHRTKPSFWMKLQSMAEQAQKAKSQAQSKKRKARH